MNVQKQTNLIKALKPCADDFVGLACHWVGSNHKNGRENQELSANADSLSEMLHDGKIARRDVGDPESFLPRTVRNQVGE